MRAQQASEPVSCWVTQAGLELREILLPQPPEGGVTAVCCLAPPGSPHFACAPFPPGHGRGLGPSPHYTQDVRRALLTQQATGASKGCRRQTPGPSEAQLGRKPDKPLAAAMGPQKPFLHPSLEDTDTQVRQVALQPGPQPAPVEGEVTAASLSNVDIERGLSEHRPHPHSARRTGMPRVSRITLGTWRADNPRRMASRIRLTRSGRKLWPEAIFRKRTTRSAPSLLYWGTHKLSSTSSKASTAGTGGCAGSQEAPELAVLSQWDRAQRRGTGLNREAPSCAGHCKSTCRPGTEATCRLDSVTRKEWTEDRAGPREPGDGQAAKTTGLHPTPTPAWHWGPSARCRLSLLFFLIRNPDPVSWQEGRCKNPGAALRCLLGKSSPWGVGASRGGAPTNVVDL